MLKLQQQNEAKIKSEYEAKFQELQSSFDELKTKMDTTSQGSKIPNTQQQASQNGAELTPQQKHEQTQKYWADRLKDLMDR